MSTADRPSGCVLVLGAEGMLGGVLMDVFQRRFGDAANDRLVGWDIAEIDISEREAVSEALAQLKPSIVVNAAAYTNVDGCETNVEQAKAVNGEAPGHIAEACRQVEATMVHFGTDFIFDGTSDRPYRPGDAANPLSVYGRSKWDGEQAVRRAGCRHMIVRTSWLFGPGKRNFVESILSRATAGQPLSVVTDQVGSPTLAADLAVAVARLLDAGAVGTVHFANAGHCSWFQFAQEIVRQAGLTAAVQPITSDQLGRPARRPPYSVLDTRSYIERVGEQPRPWQEALKAYFEARGALPETERGSDPERIVPRYQK